ncbi:MAG: endonuclease/exonuclease/phosphatase family protein [Prevotella sp.]|jgi:hypothetical protein|nr:endonuclease/exonuclease/phosphatase family protein [Prevotella sp.]
MKKNIILLLLFLSSGIYTFGQKGVEIKAIGFYNLENLFDTEKDPDINDDEFTSQGANNWTDGKYKKKLGNMAYAIDKIGKKYCPEGVAILGVSEIENKRVLEDLVNTDPIRHVNFQIIHYDSPDRRGIDVALLYNPKLFQVTSSKIYPFIWPADTTFKSRDQLLVSGTLLGEQIHIIVNHWPSRFGGNKSSEYREHAAAIVKHIGDSLYAENPKSKIIIMGDLNDDPTDISVKDVLSARKKQNEVEKHGYFNTMWNFYEKGIGSIGYQGKWSLFDQIIISEPLLGRDRSELKFWKAEVFNRDFLIQKEGKNKGYPHRTFSQSTFINGYSDHLPTLIYLVKESK